MITDAQLALIPIGYNQSMVAGAGVSIPSINTLDLMGVGVGLPPPNIIGQVSVFGVDVGVGGRFRPEIAMAVGTTFTTSNVASLNVALQAAPDPGAGGNYTPSVWTTIYESGIIAVANLTSGRKLLRGPILPVFPENLRPRFLRLLFQIPSATNFTAGSIAYATFTWVRDDFAAQYAPRNYAVA